MKLRFGTHDCAQILEDGSVTVDPRAVTAALKDARVNPYPSTSCADGAQILGIGDLVALQALVAHRHGRPVAFAGLRRWLKERL